MHVRGRDLDEWTLIWPDDEARYTVAVADGHGHPPERGWTMIEVVRARDRGAVDPSEHYPWLRCTHGVWTAAMSGATKAEQDRRLVIAQELRAGRLALPPARRIIRGALDEGQA